MARGLCPSPRLIHLSRSGLSSDSHTRGPSAWNLLSCPSQHNSGASPGLSGSTVLSTVFPEAPEQGRSPCACLRDVRSASLLVNFGSRMQTSAESHFSVSASHSASGCSKALLCLLSLFFAFIHCHHFSLPPTGSSSSVFKISPFNPLSKA